MSQLFFDTSAIVKRYVNEIGSAWVAGLVGPASGNAVHLARVTGVEAISAIARRQRTGLISRADAALMLADFRHDFFNEYHIDEISPAIIAQAMVLAEIHSLRGYDAVQLAVVMEVSAECLAQGLPLTLISADAELNAAAVIEGITVDDPNSHP